MARNMYVITNASGVVIAACDEHVSSSDGKIRALITPARADHKMFLIHDVPDEVTTLSADKFQVAITEYFRSASKKVHIADPHAIMRPRSGSRDHR